MEALQSWVRVWLEEVVARLGVKPVIYTSPSFWMTYMGDTTAFAEEGYKLNIASWDTTVSPDVPAENWGGLGWTFWQTSTCGRLAGIPRHSIRVRVASGPDDGLPVLRSLVEAAARAEREPALAGVR